MNTIKITTPYEVIRINDINDRDLSLFESKISDFLSSDDCIITINVTDNQKYLFTKYSLLKSLIKIN